MTRPALLQWRPVQPESIVCGVRWYLGYSLSDREVEERLLEPRLSVDHTTMLRWVQRYAPELDTRCRRQLKTTHEVYRVDETSIPIKKVWHCLLSEMRDAKAANKFFRYQ